MDLACGDKEHNVFAGLLIRAVIDSADKLIEGPCLVVDKILELNGSSDIGITLLQQFAVQVRTVSNSALLFAHSESTISSVAVIR